VNLCFINWEACRLYELILSISCYLLKRSVIYFSFWFAYFISREVSIALLIIVAVILEWWCFIKNYFIFFSCSTISIFFYLFKDKSFCLFYLIRTVWCSNSDSLWFPEEIRESIKLFLAISIFDRICKRTWSACSLSYCVSLILSIDFLNSYLSLESLSWIELW